jgi:AraC family transcriptional regulator of adaptative response/methylated-DNA-[protein]-cysteine methyltransferase
MKPTDEQMWRAFESKDALFDGQFVVAVKTTKIYCRPSCAAKPLRKNVNFFATPDEAEQAGYRPCKRCHPREALRPDAAKELAERAAKEIETSGSAKLEELGAKLGVSPFHLQREFKRVMGVSPAQFARAQRIQQMKLGLSADAPVTDAILSAGFNSSSPAYEQLDGLGMTPSAYKKGGAGMAIGYALMDSPLGRALIAGTQRGLCAVYFADSDLELEQALQAEYPSAKIEKHVAGGLAEWASAVLEYMRGQTSGKLLDLPLDVQGTAFQARVWQAIRQIPRGQTRTYSDLARAIGQPTSMRAVANACGANRVSVVIPCHRVVREDGASGGYRWGASRKAKLLASEGA